MPIKKICSCGKLIDYGRRYCDDCQSKEDKRKRTRNQEYDSRRKNNRETRFYNSREWQTVRQITLNKYNGIDLFLFYVENQIEIAATVHHVVEIREDYSKRLDLDNLFPCTQQTHNYIHGLYKVDKEKTQRMLIGLKKRWEQEYGTGVLF